MVITLVEVRSQIQWYLARQSGIGLTGLLTRVIFDACGQCQPRLDTLLESVPHVQDWGAIALQGRIPGHD